MAQEQEERTVLSSKSAERFFFKQVSVFQIKKLRLSARFKVTQILYIIYYWQLRFDKLQKNCAKHIHLVSDDWKGFYKVKKVILFILCEWWRIYHLLKKTLTLSFFISSRVIFTNGFYSKTDYFTERFSINIFKPVHWRYAFNQPVKKIHRKLESASL